MQSIRVLARRMRNHSCNTVAFLMCGIGAFPTSFITPRTDVCHYCEDYCIAIQGDVTDSDKTTLVAEFGKYLEETQKERDAYLAVIEKAKKKKRPAQVKSQILVISRLILHSKCLFHFIHVRWARFTTKCLCVCKYLEFVVMQSPFKSITYFMKDRP